MHRDAYQVVRAPSCLAILIKNMLILQQNIRKLLQDRKSPHVKRHRGQKEMRCLRGAYAALLRALARLGACEHLLAVANLSSNLCTKSNVVEDQLNV